MTFTSDERREVAERLRVYSHDFDFGDSNPFWYVAKAAFGDVDVHTYYSVFARLADLMDLPTCQMKSIPESDYRVCSRCGAFVRRDAATDCTEAIHVRFCPNCGARVVDGGRA